MADDSAVRVEMTAQSRRIMAQMKSADAKKDLRKQLRSATTKLQPAVRRAVRNTPSTRSRRKTPGGSLRAAVASSIVRKIKMNRNGIMVLITNAPRGGKSNIARCLDGTIPWVHPVYGKPPDVNQQPHPFFYGTVESLLPDVNAQVEHVLADFEKQL